MEWVIHGGVANSTMIVTGWRPGAGGGGGGGGGRGALPISIMANHSTYSTNHVYLHRFSRLRFCVCV